MSLPIRDQVRAFYQKFTATPDRVTPGVPSEYLISLRLNLVLEEVMELAAACGAEIDGSDSDMGELRIKAGLYLARLDLIAVADALADIDYVVEGLRQAFGIDGQPIADAVHEANMAKEGGGTRGDGKIMKPAGWQPADIMGLLLAQGWDGKEGAPLEVQAKVAARKELDALRQRVSQLEAFSGLLAVAVDEAADLKNLREVKTDIAKKTGLDL